MVRSLQPINTLPPLSLSLPSSSSSSPRATDMHWLSLLFSFSYSHLILSSPLPFFLYCLHSTFLFLLLFSIILSVSLLSFFLLLPSLLSPPSLFPCLGALMASMYSSSDTVTSAGREGLSLTTQPANEIFPHLINTIRILILTESI